MTTVGTCESTRPESLPAIVSDQPLAVAAGGDLATLPAETLRLCRRCSGRWQIGS